MLSEFRTIEISIDQQRAIKYRLVSAESYFNIEPLNVLKI